MTPRGRGALLVFVRRALHRLLHPRPRMDGVYDQAVRGQQLYVQRLADEERRAQRRWLEPRAR
jgi:hypothetical protein